MGGRTSVKRALIHLALFAMAWTLQACGPPDPTGIWILQLDMSASGGHGSVEMIYDCELTLDLDHEGSVVTGEAEMDCESTQYDYGEASYVHQFVYTDGEVSGTFDEQSHAIELDVELRDAEGDVRTVELYGSIQGREMSGSAEFGVFDGEFHGEA